MDKLLFTDTFKGLVKFSKIRTDNDIFRLHYRFTGLVLITFSVLVTANQFFGDPIHCITHDAVPEKVMNTYCWIEGTITLPRALNKTVGHEVAHPGVDQMKITDKDEVLEHAYYQWVCFVLFLQALMFYFPRWLWRSWEKGRIKSLLMELDKPLLDNDKKKTQVTALGKYFLKHQNHHQAYALRYFICEVLNFVNVIGQIYFVNRFLGGEFTSYGPRVVEFLNTDQEDRNDPMIRVFPRVTKCRFHRFGPSGDVQRHDSLCLLPLNIINEKIYVFLWFWFVILAILSGLTIVYRISLLAFPKTRFSLLRTFTRMVDPSVMDIILREADYGDWFVLFLLKDNVRGIHFRDVLTDLAERYEEERTNKKLYKLESKSESVA